MVMYNSTWDYKNRYSQTTRYWYKGDSYSGEEFGNIHYGYIGAAAGFTTTTLDAGAGAVQKVLGAGGSLRCYFDDCRDTAKINQGVSDFKKDHPLLNGALFLRRI